MSYRKNAMLLSCLAFAVGTAQGATITEDFESELTNGTAPIGWALVNTGTATYSTTASTGNPGQSGNFTYATRGNTNNPSAYLVNSGVAFDATQSITGSFDFYLVEQGNYSNANFIIGDVQNGLSNTAGEYFNVLLDEKQYGSRADIYDGAGTTLFNGNSDNNAEIKTNEWNVATFTWTPTSGKTGDFTINWDGPGHPGTESMSITGYTFDSAAVYFGFGTGDTSSRFDNISITGTEVGPPAPEPGSLALLGLGGLLTARRRRA